MSGVISQKLENSVDATRGQPLAMRVLARKDELEDALAELGPYDIVERQAIETALATVYLLMTGDLAHPSAVVARDLNRWLERNKHLGQEITRRQQAARLARLTADRPDERQAVEE
ncbi:MAG TPA: hypothetical protein VFV99_22115 [Kofleriaceae bacterium]|nr:hypothetical protein [Kofleriaceae bacterium]